MKFHATARGASGVALAALFLVGGCTASQPSDSAARDGTAALAKADVARPPAVADEANQVEAAPLNDAGEIASEIESNTMIGRVPVDGGLAWLQDGEVVRTASADGRRVAYFHPGERQPFLVQARDVSFAYDDGRPERAYDRDGRPARIPDRARAEAERLAAESGREAAEAEQTLPGDREG